MRSERNLSAVGRLILIPVLLILLIPFTSIVQGDGFVMPVYEDLSYILEEDGRFEEGLIEQYLGMKLIQQPRMIRAAQASSRSSSRPSVPKR